MSEAKHTKGPWRLHLVDDTTVIDSNGRFVASVCGGDDELGDQDYNNPDEWPALEANARLIAAAPELLAGCIKAVELLEPFERTGLLGEAVLPPIRAAIAKVRGEGLA